MISEYLTAAELASLIGCRPTSIACMKCWLAKNGWPHVAHAVRPSRAITEIAFFILIHEKILELFSSLTAEAGRVKDQAFFRIAKCCAL
ncbi:hypothetical protein RC54_04055 [Herbaspirillum rubrisubalbicans]|uniref:DUF4224 domain-containing protein n=1 Tax=Herbaspirillum rubrisubalbicans TaxID=80842 RepID=A0AAD0U5F4_9BURK|nr:hypothetical protein RC54_04055 [Herbaspirillum rubrisubalbicans]